MTIIKRKCRQCSKVLPKDRYFNCKSCLEELESDAQDDFKYEDTVVKASELSYIGVEWEK